ncbi:hypothetical protein PHLGIDRAFT_125118 [Phlebiopsis gigantea 11061_1 CR5-6]|uniref:Uncharacterized protein n=1 Tax=Phlebiopsis gigantea (strain 11061_1 CR5-6) TaxID=745531 RepID=A0A0C3SEV2_PHLG1|nr:hypothetical protein PHLGIDRAFT_125118 [Phlebiopsis gigantea 11061_1 CR5-6]
MAISLLHRLYSIFMFFALMTSTLSQTVTTTDALGETIVADVTVDPNLGLPTTIVLETLTDGGLPTSLPTTSSTPLTSTTTPATATPVVVTPATTPDQVGPVGAPPTTTGDGPTVYTYTTTNPNGATIAVIDTFTPVYAPSTPFTPATTGTIWDFSSYVAAAGTNTATSNLVSGSLLRMKMSGTLAGLSAGFVVGILTGAWVAFA